MPHRLQFAALVLVGFLASSAINAKTYTFGVVPQQAAAKLARLWTPILNDVSARAGVVVRFRTAPNIPEFEARVRRGEYDFAYMNPYHFTVFHENPGYVAVARQAQKQIRGLIVVARDGPLTSLEELAGGQVAFPAPAAFAATVLPRAEMLRRGIDVEPRYVSSHDSVYRAVAKGLFNAGGGIQRTLANVDAKTREQLRVLWTTRGYTPHAIAAHPRVAPGIRQRLADALIGLSSDAAGRELLATIKFKAIEPATDSDWDDVRALDLRAVADLSDS
ncbi:MAG: phosphate/phosphite/phosphonate ABC transporter substrate-binding protein [Pseudomonadota bacterium]